MSKLTIYHPLFLNTLCTEESTHSRLASRYGNERFIQGGDETVSISLGSSFGRAENRGEPSAMDLLEEMYARGRRTRGHDGCRRWNGRARWWSSYCLNMRNRCRPPQVVEIEFSIFCYLQQKARNDVQITAREDYYLAVMYVINWSTIKKSMDGSHRLSRTSKRSI